MEMEVMPIKAVQSALMDIDIMATSIFMMSILDKSKIELLPEMIRDYQKEIESIVIKFDCGEKFDWIEELKNISKKMRTKYKFNLN